MLSLCQSVLAQSEKLMKAGDSVNIEYVNAMLSLSMDIGTMADRIGEMADRILETEDKIGEMADRILATQELQNQNVALTQQNLLLAQQNFNALLLNLQ